MSGATILNWSGDITPAEKELSETEIDARYGVLMRDAVSAFKDDPSYLVEMAESAALLRYKRQMWEARVEAQKECRDKEQVRELTQRIMAERGIYPPARSNRRRRKAAA